MASTTNPRPASSKAQDLLIKSPAYRPGYTLIAKPGTSPLRWITLGRLILNLQKSRYEGSTGPHETVLDFFAGQCTVTVHGKSGSQAYFAGRRGDAFSGNPSMVYVPPGHDYSVESAGEAVIAVFSAPAEADGARPVLVSHEQTMVKEIGRDNWSRRVMTSIGDNVPARRLIIGETLNPPGNWSSAPPHKHDQHRPPQEAVMEEVYYFQLKPSQGFGFMRVYTAPDDPEPFDEAFVVEDGDTVLIPRGYHPVVAGPGYQLHYTWALAGDERRYGAWSDDPRHAWIKE